MISPDQSRSEASSEPYVPYGRPMTPQFANVSLTKSEASVLHTLKDDSNSDRSARGNISRASSERSVIASLADASEASVLLSLQDHTVMPLETSRSFSLTLPANHGSNLFDMSLDMPPIPSSSAAGLMSDDPIEVVDYDLTRSDGGSSHRSSTSRKAVDHSLGTSPAPSTIRSAHSTMGPTTPTPVLRSDHSLHFVSNSPSFIGARSAQAPRANISSSMVEDEVEEPELQAPARSFLGSLANITWSNPPIPGAFNFSSFFTHANTSSSSSSSGSSSPRTPSPKPFHALDLAAEPDLDDEASAIISAQSELIRSLREQLAVQEDLSEQFELDLNSQDEVVRLLSERCGAAEAEVSCWHEHGEKQSRAVRRMTRRITELERMCTRLQDEVDHSQSESLERSIMDETSGRALKTLHRQISTLESQNRELVLRSEEREARITELEASEEDAQTELEQLKTHIDKLMGANDELHEQLELQPAAEALGDLHRNIRKLEGELTTTRDELEAQWVRTEENEDKISMLQEEKADLKREVEDLKRDLDSKDLRIEELEASNLELDALVDGVNERTQQLEAEHGKVCPLSQSCSIGSN
jgi:peptidoglycan hydrolase CwlO-like protein